MKDGKWIAEDKDGNKWDPSTSSRAGEQTALFYKAIKDGKTRIEALELCPSMGLRFFDRYDSIQRAVVAARAEAPPGRLVDFRGISIPVGLPRYMRQTQYWLYGPPGVGKTHFLMDLMGRLGYRAFQLAGNNDLARYDDDAIDFAYADECNDSTRTKQPPFDPSTTNTWCDGSPLQLNTKGGSRYKAKNITMFYCSNIHPSKFFRPHSFFPPVALRAVLSRLTVIYCPDRETALVEQIGGEPPGEAATKEQKEAWESLQRAPKFGGGAEE